MEVAVGASSTKSGGGIGGVSSNIEDDRERREICQGESITITLSVTERNIRGEREGGGDEGGEEGAEMEKSK